MGLVAPSLPRNGDDLRYAMNRSAAMADQERTTSPPHSMRPLRQGFRRFRCPGESPMKLVGVSEGLETPRTIAPDRARLAALVGECPVTCRTDEWREDGSYRRGP